MTNPHTHKSINERVKQRINQVSVLNKFSQNLEEKERKIKKIQELEEKRIQMEGLIKRLKGKSEELEKLRGNKVNAREDILKKVSDYNSELLQVSPAG